MSESLFRLGSVYRQQDGAVVRLDWCATTRCPGFVQAVFVERDGTNGERYLTNGRYPYADEEDNGNHLIPGELHKVNGEWISMTPTLDKLEAEKEVDDGGPYNGLAGEAEPQPKAEPAFVQQLRDLLAIQGKNGTWNADGYMCGLYNGLEMALATIEVREPQYRTLKAPVQVPGAALTRMSEGDHRFGLGRAFG